MLYEVITQRVPALLCLHDHSGRDLALWCLNCERFRLGMLDLIDQLHLSRNGASRLRRTCTSYWRPARLLNGPVACTYRINAVRLPQLIQLGTDCLASYNFV